MKLTMRNKLNGIYQFYGSIRIEIYEQIQNLCKHSGCRERIGDFVISTELKNENMGITVEVVIRNMSCEDQSNLLTIGSVLVLTTDSRLCDVKLTVSKHYLNIKEL
jgi:hypothetical protein